MKSTTHGGLLAGIITAVAAANEEPGSRTARVPVRSDDSSDHGWDPFEVWRTRVKEPRERHVLSAADRPKSCTKN
jgi:hypothetical protein